MVETSSTPDTTTYYTITTTIILPYTLYSSMASTTRPGGKRLPISCQACRIRKIRCSRDGRPCQTCVRRGLGAMDCVYLGQPRLSSEQQTSSSSGDLQVQNELLLARIRRLEGLLQKQARSSAISQPAVAGVGPADSLSPQTTYSTTGSSSESPDSAIGLGSQDSRRPVLGHVGSLQNISGYVRYVPLASQWNSVVNKNSTGGCLQNIDAEIPDDEDDLQIPLVRNGSVSKEELLGVLPPGKYCDILKDVYFRVFSPVC